MTVLVIVRLNRQVLLTAAELRSRPGAGAVAPGDVRGELLQYAASIAAIEQQWSETVADFRTRYPNDATYQSVATAQAVHAINELRRPQGIGPLHERWAQAWSDRDAALWELA